MERLPFSIRAGWKRTASVTYVRSSCGKIEDPPARSTIAGSRGRECEEAEELADAGSGGTDFPGKFGLGAYAGGIQEAFVAEGNG